MKIYGNNKTLKDNYGTDGIEKFVMDTLRQFPAGLNSEENYSTNKNNCLNEAFFRTEFYSIANKLIGINTQISVEVKKVRGKMTRLKDRSKKSKGKYPKLDMYVDGDKDWAIEFLITNNKSIKDTIEHIGRFVTKTGKYSTLPYRKFLVVDFRPITAIHKECYQQVSQKIKCAWLVHYNEDFSILTIYRFDENGGNQDYDNPQEIQLINPNMEIV